MVVERKTHHGGLAGLTARLSQLTHMAVLVGIPSEKSGREGESKAINNAELMYIHTHGSPVRNIPPRPVIEPAIEANRTQIMAQYSKAAHAAAAGNNSELNSALIRTGLAGQNAARAWFTDPRNGWPLNAPSTIARKGSSRPLIDTGTLRKSITYVVRDDG